ncbi:hypothetical protein L211DRAFT_895241, partial [Terfezia boudieri ATCC MYA-4762]
PFHWAASLGGKGEWLAPLRNIFYFIKIYASVGGGGTPCSNKGGFKIKSHERIGHDLDVISLIIGSLLGNTYLEKRVNNSFAGTRIIFVQTSDNVEYLM